MLPWGRGTLRCRGRSPLWPMQMPARQLRILLLEPLLQEWMVPMNAWRLGIAPFLLALGALSCALPPVSPPDEGQTRTTEKPRPPVAPRPENWARPIDGKAGLPNFHQVDGNLYRGAQPKEMGFPELKKMGIRTVINLRTWHSDRKKCKEAGLDYLKISVQAWEPEEEEVVEFLRAVTRPDRQPVFLHCQHGADRTGMMVGVYRIVVQGWSKEEAIKEMTEGGYGYHTIWKDLITYLRDLDVDRLKKKIAP